MADPFRPLIRYYGGKWMLAPRIIALFPAHRVYVEPFGGGASILLRKPRSYAEVYNDLDDEIVNLFTVARDQGEQLARALSLTPFSRTEFKLAYRRTDDPLERARRTLVRSFMGHGNGGHGFKNTGFRCDSNRRGTTPAHDWWHFPDCLAATIERLRGVVIECRDYAAILETFDREDCLFYLDPPYPHATRNQTCRTQYAKEMTDDDHRAFLNRARALRGMAVVSSYPNPIYDAALADWQHHDLEAHADGAAPRIERVWLNPAAASRPKLSDSRTLDVFGA